MVGEILPLAARRFGDKVSVILGTATFSFSELDSMSNRVANGLVSVGVRPGDRFTLVRPELLGVDRRLLRQPQDRSGGAHSPAGGHGMSGSKKLMETGGSPDSVHPQASPRTRRAQYGLRPSSDTSFSNEG